MAYEQLKSNIRQYIRQNGQGAITGQILQDTLIGVVNALAANSQFGGIASTVETPDTEANVFYLATAGTYEQFGGLEVGANELAIFEYKSEEWVKESLLEGTDVEANPTGEATEDLDKLKVGEKIYKVPQTDTSGLATKQELSQGLEGKQDTISDLSTIRSGAEAGATAMQPPAQQGNPGQVLQLDSEGNPIWGSASVRYQDLVDGLAYGGIVNSSASFTPDTNSYYITNGAGTYTAFGSVEVYSNDHVQILTYDGTQWQVTELPWYTYAYAHGKFALLDDFGGATDSTNGTTGLVPAPQAGDEEKILGGSGEWVEKPSDGANGLSAYQVAVQEGFVGSVDDWLASLKAQIGAFKFVANDATAEAALTTYGSTYSSAISGVSPTSDTVAVILLMNDDDTTPTKTMMIATEEASTPGTYEFVYVGDLQSAMPSNVVTGEIVNDLTTGGATDVLSAEQGKILAGNETITETQTLSYPEGTNVTVVYPIGLSKGVKYTISINSNVANSGYVRISGKNLNNQATQINQQTIDLSVNTLSVQFTPSEDMAYLEVYVRGVAEADSRTLTATVVSIRHTAIDNHVVEKLGKNLCNPDEIVYGRYITKNIVSWLDGLFSSMYQGTTHAVTGYIPIKNGQTLVCNKTANSNTYNNCALYARKGDMVAISGKVFNNLTSSGYQAITNDTGADAYAVFSIGSASTNVQVEVGSTPTTYEKYNPVIGYFDEGVNYNSYGTIGINYPEELDKILNVLDVEKYGSHPCLRFIHVSDSHGANIGEAETLIDQNIGAEFLVHTGDMVADKFTDDFDVLKAKLLAITKPTFIVLGNHDCYQSSSVGARFTKFIDPLNTHNGLTGNTKTYYKVDYQSEKVKCIFLDMSDAIEDVSLNMSYYVSQSKMTSNQINWFISELKDAITNTYHVAIFMHISPAYISKPRYDWYDKQIQEATGVNFLCDIVDAFIEGTSFSVEHDGNTYTDTFASKGAFCGWFCGHTHYDAYGQLENHEDQFSGSVPRPMRNSDQYDSTFRVPKLGITFDYVVINTHSRKVGIYRVGNQETIYGTEKEAIYYTY